MMLAFLPWLAVLALNRLRVDGDAEADAAIVEVTLAVKTSATTKLIRLIIFSLLRRHMPFNAGKKQGESALEGVGSTMSARKAGVQRA